jgi:Asp-tRNA(Asn)/Glu-tRNA(Gln) amidotransferase A subunit family amidase
VTKVSAKLDALPDNFKLSSLNGVARGAYVHYNAKKMEGLPVGVQVVGQRLTEERVLAMMIRVEEALKKAGNEYELLQLD